MAPKRSHLVVAPRGSHVHAPQHQRSDREGLLLGQQTINPGPQPRDGEEEEKQDKLNFKTPSPSRAVVFNQGSATPRGSGEVLQGVIQLKKK